MHAFDADVDLSQSAADSLGGDLAWALGVSVFAPFPTKKEWPVKLHGFLNTGRVVGWESGKLPILRSWQSAEPSSVYSSIIRQQRRTDVQFSQHECWAGFAVQVGPHQGGGQLRSAAHWAEGGRVGSWSERGHWVGVPVIKIWVMECHIIL